MPARRKAAAVALGLAAPALAALSAAPAAAHGSMGDPVSRVAQCYAQGPQSPRSDACRAAVAAGGAQALYDWNGIRIGDANGRHQELIPDGRLCSAGNEEFKGLDLARADWPATAVDSGPYTFGYRVTAPHKGTFKVYLTKAGYDPARPLAWSDLDLAHPVATAVDPVATGGFSTFSGTLPERSGRQLLYAVWQRSDSPEAFYSCSDVTFPGGGAGAGAGSGTEAGAGSGTGAGSGSGTGDGAAPAASAPSEEQIRDGADRSTVEHHGHGDDGAATTTDPTAPGTPSADGGARDATGASANAPRAADVRAGSGERLARTGGDGSASYLAVGGAAVLALGAALLFASVRRRAASAGWHGR
ncbi:MULTISPECIES: lytic polysaccharide monooxygenase auxiliary activity family 9 protein [unclassified Streptomyces]|uniref:lytic polysaccharide monooxygenase auxiliary activity family 9 protein n=1 Tax=unclassified Streptomyces TaxID=2593676 RepID=UPI00070AED86|nr:lytic polysaccharide monooxygenase [Streptomyces sp. Root264]KRD16275.1 chitin-binding protein [Streptomyces sp. Root264]